MSGGSEEIGAQGELDLGGFMESKIENKRRELQAFKLEALRVHGEI